MESGIDEYWLEDNPEFHSFYNVEREILSPFIADIINKYKPQNVLDFGCGNGYLSTLLDKDIDITLYDKNKSVLEKTYNDKAFKTSHFKDLKEKIFDIVVNVSVLMCISSEKVLDEALSQMNGCLKEKGKLITVITHPCFLQYDFGHYHTNFDKNKFNYSKEKEAYEVYMRNGSNESLTFTDYHWTLEIIVKKILNLGHRIVKMVEHEDLKSSLYEPNRNVPPWLFIISEKNEGK